MARSVLLVALVLVACAALPGARATDTSDPLAAVLDAGGAAADTVLDWVEDPPSICPSGGSVCTIHIVIGETIDDVVATVMAIVEEVVDRLDDPPSAPT